MNITSRKSCDRNWSTDPPTTVAERQEYLWGLKRKLTKEELRDWGPTLEEMRDYNPGKTDAELRHLGYKSGSDPWP